jgi:hypothetical protein
VDRNAKNKFKSQNRNMDTVKPTGLKPLPFILIIAILVIAILAFLVWALLSFNQVQSKDASVEANPYCPRFLCHTGTQPLAYTVDAAHDPQRTGTARVNWCVINSAPAPLAESIKKCTSNSQNLIPLIEPVANYYANTYLPECAYDWKTTGSVPVGDDTYPGTEGPIDDPNDPVTLNGINDDFVIDLIACADDIGMENPDIEILRDKYCGAPCQR